MILPLESALPRLRSLVLLASITLTGCQFDSSESLGVEGPGFQDKAAEVEARVDQLLAGLTLEQKIAQMIQGEIKHVTPDDVRRYGLGSVLNGGGSFPDEDKYATVEEWQQLADDYYLASIDAAGGHAGIPIIWGTDAVHGHNNVIGATLFPHNIGLGAAGDPELVARIAGATAREVRATGIDWIFAPTIAVAKDYRWGRTYESYSSDPAVVKSFAGGVVEAMQAQGVASTAKHFIGDGGTYRGIDQGDTRLPLDELLEEHGAGYESALAAGAMSVMASFNSWNGEKVHGNRELLTDVLKGQMAFDGFVVSDWNGIGQVAGCEDDDCVQSVNAGMDMIMVPEDWETLLHNMVAQVNAGEIPMARIDDAVRRILRVKIKSGLMTRGLPSASAQAFVPSLGSEDHRALAREAVRRSLVLLKNNGQLLPLSPRGNYLLVGSAANDIGRQSGGWTISWQGTGNQNSDFPGATSIEAGLKEQIEAAGGRLYTEADLAADPKIDAVIVAFGEAPYAEGQGDIESLAWQPLNQIDLKTLKRFEGMGYSTVSLFVTGRPRWVNAELNASDAFVVAWLPGSEGSGVADVLLRDSEGRVQYDFVGRLPMAWPATDINATDANLPVDDFVFDLGYGLSASSNIQLATLNEVPLGTVEDSSLAIFAGGVKEPWTLFLGDQQDWALPVTAGKAQSQTGQVELSTFDYRVQEDARHLQFAGDGSSPAQVFFASKQPRDFSVLAEEGAALLVELRVTESRSESVKLRMDCGYPCAGEMDITSMLDDVMINSWRRVAFPLACFDNAGTDMELVDVAFHLNTSGRLGLDIAEISVTDDYDDALLQPCADPPSS